MKKLSLNDFAKANVALEKKGMKSVKGGDGKNPKEIDVLSWSWGVAAGPGTHFKDATLTI
jgi:natural product precursor